MEGGIENALYDKLRPGAVPKITGEIEAQLTLLACSAPLDGRARWTLQLLADKLVDLKLVDSISFVHSLQPGSSPIDYASQPTASSTW